jgi:hypothetical protein
MRDPVVAAKASLWQVFIHSKEYNNYVYQIKQKPLQNLQQSIPQLQLSKRGAKVSKKVLRRKGKPGREAPLRAL